MSLIPSSENSVCEHFPLSQYHLGGLGPLPSIKGMWPSSKLEPCSWGPFSSQLLHVCPQFLNLSEFQPLGLSSPGGQGGLTQLCYTPVKTSASGRSQPWLLAQPSLSAGSWIKQFATTSSRLSSLHVEMLSSDPWSLNPRSTHC